MKCDYGEHDLPDREAHEDNQDPREVGDLDETGSRIRPAEPRLDRRRTRGGETAQRLPEALLRPGWVVVAGYNDNDTSASGKRRRPGFEAMLTAAKAAEFDIIVSWHLDRLTRTLKDYLPLADLAEKHGVAVTTVAGDIDLTTDMGQVVAGMLAVVANGEIRRKGARQSRANLQRAEAGLPSIGGAAPIGFAPDKVSLDEPAAEVVRQAYADLLAGMSVSQIARNLSATGYTTVRKGKWTRSGVIDLLTAARNAGLREYKGETIGRAAWPAIVDEGTWRAALAILADPARRTNGHAGGTRRWLGTSLYRCARCDAQTVASSYREQTSTGEKVRAYFCKGGAGRHLSRRADVVDEYVIEELIARLSRRDAIKLLVDRDAPDMARLTREADKLRGRLEALAVEFATTDVMTPAMLTAATKTLRARLADVEARMAHHTRTSVLGDIVTADDVWETWSGYDIDRQRAILDAVCVVTIHPSRPGGNSRTTRRSLPPGSVTVEFRA